MTTRVPAGSGTTRPRAGAGAAIPNPRMADMRAVRREQPGPRGDSAEGPQGWRDRLVRFTNVGPGNQDDPDAAVDRVASFRPAILAIRWGTTAVSLALAAGSFGGDMVIAGWSVALLVYTVLRTLRPIRYLDDLPSLVAVMAEVVLLVLVVSTTGYWESPFVFSLLTAIIVAGFARGFGFGIRIGVVSALAVSIPFLAEPTATDADLRIAAQWSVSLTLIGLVAGYARRISGEADRQHSLALDRLGRLADANSLLFSLHRVTQTLPASLEMGDVLDTTVTRLKGLFDFDSSAVLLLDETDTNWEVIRREGLRLPRRLDDSELPPPLQRAIAEQSAVMVRDLEGAEGPGLSGRAGSGLYAVLPARGALIGLLAIESRAADSYTPRDAELFRGFVEPVALAIDNARWFARLRTVGADEERTRIARDLHDRIGQSLAYLGFELDRIINKDEAGDPISGDLDQLRHDVRGVTGEVRDTLYDLRTDVSDTQGIADVLEQFTGRVGDRADLDIELYCDRAVRLPILQEREMWRVAQEAITNIEKHAEATRVAITWRCGAKQAVLEVVDDGKGFPIATAGRLDSYGILGMRERASSIGATLDIDSNPDRGTTVRCTLEIS